MEKLRFFAHVKADGVDVSDTAASYQILSLKDLEVLIRLVQAANEKKGVLVTHNKPAFVRVSYVGLENRKSDGKTFTFGDRDHGWELTQELITLFNERAEKVDDFDYIPV